MTKKKYQRYSSEFKSLALKRTSKDGVTDKQPLEIPEVEWWLLNQSGRRSDK